MDVTRMLEADHRQVEKLFERIEKAEAPERPPLVEEVVRMLHGHMKLEEQLVYPRMEPVTGAEHVEEGVTEHDLTRKTIEDFVALAPDEPGFGAVLDALRAGVLHHVEEEEGEIFPQLRKHGQEILADLATPVMEARTEMGMPIDADALAASASKDELLAEAKAAHVNGASSMNKAELADALVKVMA